MVINQNDEYQYWLQLARYWILCNIHYGKEFDWIIDAVKASGNYAYESYKYNSSTLKKIAVWLLFPALDRLIDDIDNNNFDDHADVRQELINDRYYPVLDGAIQQEYRVIEPAFY